jgi:hypothetical protein
MLFACNQVEPAQHTQILGHRVLIQAEDIRHLTRTHRAIKTQHQQEQDSGFYK